MAFAYNGVAEFFGAKHDSAYKSFLAAGELKLTIIDSGDGLDPVVLEQIKGNGWRNIDARLYLLGSAPSIFSHPDEKRTEFRASISVRRKMRA